MLSPEEKDEERRATGRRVRMARERARLSVSELAERAGLPRQYVYDLEGGIRVSVTNVAAVSRAMGVSMDYLIGIQPGQDAARPGAPVHDCCYVAADRDACLRLDPGGAGLVRLRDGTYVPLDTLAKELLDGGIAEKITGDRIEMIRCGEYRWRGETWRLGEREPVRDGDEAG